MNLLHDIETRDESGHVRVVVEVAAGNRLKLKYDPAIGAFVWSRLLAAGVSFPYDYGFVPRTTGGDDDALDALVLSDVASYPGVVVPGRVIGALRVEQQRDGKPVRRNDRLVLVPLYDHHRAHVSEVAELPERTRAELEEFFRASLVLTGKRVRLCGWADAAEANQLVDEAAARYEASAAAAIGRA